jgi:succinate dehydrogenase/fumarate reductase flavoprotein subunit
MTETVACDLVVVGSGAAGLSAAVTAAHLGLDVVVVEKERQIGGTSAWSGGWLWVPRNPLAVAAGIVEEIDAPLAYLRAELGEGHDESLALRFLTEAPRMVAFMQANTALDFIDGNAIPDFHGASDGAATGGRSICAAPFDGRRLGPRISDLKPPLDLIAPFGMGIAAGADLRHFLGATRTWPSFLHAAKRILRHARDVLRHGRGMHLVNGNALMARLLKSADDLGVVIRTSAPARELMRGDDGAVAGVVCGEGELRISARRGVVLAAGGFPHDTARKARMFPHAPTGEEHFSAAPASNTGDGLRLGESAGGRVREDFSNAGAWAPVSLPPDGKGAVGRFPHLMERAKPGLVMVRADGRRFANEADSYHDLMQALFAATPPGETAGCWMICDHAFIRRYGLGRARPRPFPLAPWIANGYLRWGRTVAELAAHCGIEARGLGQTVSDFNGPAAAGLDPAFGRGSSVYNRFQGEAEQQPNPCVRPLGPGPFYAVRIAPGSLGTFSGLDTDADARALDARGRPIAGLYVVGNDMASIMRGRYPAGGITLGPGMTFGYIAAHHAAGVPLDNNRSKAAPAAPSEELP